MEKVAEISDPSMDGNGSAIPQPEHPKDVPESLLPVEATAKTQTPKSTPTELNRTPTPAAAVHEQPQLQDVKLSAPTVVRSSSPVPPRPEAPRTVSNNAVNGHLLHGLPSRPEVAAPRVREHRMADRERSARDLGRDSRYPPQRGTDGSRNAMHDRAPERQGPPLQQRSYERPDRLHNAERERTQSGYGAEKGLPGRTDQDERYPGSSQGRDPHDHSRADRNDRPQRDWGGAQMNSGGRSSEPQGQSSRDRTMAPPASTILQHPDRTALIHGATEREQPQFEGQNQDRRQEARRFEAHPTSQRSSRPGSPSSLDDRRNLRPEQRRDDRPPVDVRHAPESLANGRLSRYEDSRFPTGPRTDRSGPSSQSSPQDRFRESPRHTSGPSLATDQYRRDHSMDRNTRQQESQYGRLNPGPEIPSGPRLPNGNPVLPQRAASRNVSAPHLINTQQAQPLPTMQNSSTASQEKQTPTGPSSRGPPRNAPPPLRPDSVQSGPPTSATESPDTAGVHPDRLRAIQGAAGASSVNAAQPSNLGRPLRQSIPPLSVPPSPGQRPNGHMPSPGGPLQSPGPMQGSTVQSPTSRGPPTGPSFNHDRSRGEKRMFAGLQNTLHQAGTLNGPERSSQGASIRGRGGRANNPSLPSASVSGPPTPAVPVPPAEVFPSRSDLFANRPPSHQNIEAEAGYGRGARPMGGRREPLRDSLRDVARDGGPGRMPPRDDGRAPPRDQDQSRDEERRSGHHRRSRDHSRDTGPPLPMPPRDDDRLPRRNDLRDRGRPPMPPPMERDMRRAPPPRLDEQQQRRAESDRREMDSWNGDRGNGMERRNDRDRRDGGGSGGRKRGRGGEEGHGESKRPRRSG